METKIKICGLTRQQDIEYCNEALPDFIGFVFAKSRRQVSFKTAEGLKASLDNRIKSVGVFVNDDIPFIKRLCVQGIIDYIQLHGDEDNSYIQCLTDQLVKADCLKPIIKAVRVKDAQSLSKAGQYCTDFLLLDTFTDKEYGGTGRSFDWELVGRLRVSGSLSNSCGLSGTSGLNVMDKPFFLAGGLNYTNVIQAINTARPFCVDISSGVESSGVESNGVKDGAKIKNIVNLIRSVK